MTDSEGRILGAIEVAVAASGPTTSDKPPHPPSTSQSS